MYSEHIGKYYSVEKLALITGINPNWIRYLKSTKKIPFFQESPGSKILIPFDDFITYLEKYTNKPTEEEIFASKVGKEKV